MILTKENFDVNKFKYITGKYIAVDTETTGLSFKSDSLLGISFWIEDMEEGFFITKENLTPEIKESLRLLFVFNTVVFHNSTFDLYFLLKEGFGFNKIHDTLLMANMIQAQKTALKEITLLLGLGDSDTKPFAQVLEENGAKDFLELLNTKPEVAAEYAIRDVRLTLALFHKLYGIMLNRYKMSATDLDNILELQNQSNLFLAKVNNKGLKVDLDFLESEIESNKEKYAKKVEDLTNKVKDLFRNYKHEENKEPYWNKLSEYFTQEKNIDKVYLLGRKDQTHLIYNVLGYKKPKIKLNAKGVAKEPALDATTLGKLKDALIDDIVDVKSEQRQISSLKSIKSLIGADNTIPLGFSAVGFNCIERIYNANNGTLPLTSTPYIKKSFTAEDDKMWVYADLSSAELTIIAAFSGDYNLISAVSSEDPHSYIAQKLFNLNVSRTENKHLREVIKKINFAALYSCFNLNYINAMVYSRFKDIFTGDEVNEIISKYAMEFNHTINWVEQTLQDCISNNGRITYGMGLQKDCGIISTHMTPAQYGSTYEGRLAINTIGQNTCALILKSIIKYMSTRVNIDKIHNCIPVFDSLAFKIDKDYYDEFMTIFNTAMTPYLHHNGNNIQMRCDMKKSDTNLAELEPVEVKNIDKEYLSIYI